VPRRKKNGLGGSMIIVIVLSSFTAFIICVGLACLLLLKCGYGAHRSKQIPHALISSPKKSSGKAFYQILWTLLIVHLSCILNPVIIS
jgi:hypothetical protein